MKDCDLLAISTAVSVFLINKLDNGGVSFLGDLFTAIGANLTLAANNAQKGGDNAASGDNRE